MADAVLPITSSTFRLFVHVLAATIWVGGQLTLAGLVPVLRAHGSDIPRAAARRFNRIAWPAFAVLIASGLWNIAAVGPSWNTAYGRTLTVKLATVAVSGVTAFVHIRVESPRSRAIWGALTGLSALVALFLATML